MNQTIKIKLAELNDFKPREGLNKLSFELEEVDLNKSSGEKILTFLKELRNKKVDFKITKALPRCLFGFDYHNIISEFGMPKNCKECPELFSVDENGMAVFCCTLKHRIGPKFEYMKDKEHIYEYFKTFYDQLETLEKCKSCRYAMRKQCNTCFNKK